MQRVTPFLWFDGQAKRAARFYTSVFRGSGIVGTSSMSVTFRLDGREYIAFNGGPEYKFSPAVSLFVSCKNQKEIDYYWKRLSAGGKILRCGWLKDKFGLCWQIVPSILGALLGDPDREKAGRAMAEMMRMKKLDIQRLKRAHAG